MVVLAVSAAWVGVVGTAVGGVLGFLTSWLVHYSERKERTDERSRAERKEAYAALLSSADDTMHRFEWLAEGLFGPAGSEEDRKTAVRFYDEELVPKLNVLKLIGEDRVVEAGSAMRHSLGKIRRPLKAEELPDRNSRGYKAAHEGYREARNTFIELARADLEPKDARTRAATTP